MAQHGLGPEAQTAVLWVLASVAMVLLGLMAVSIALSITGG